MLRFLFPERFSENASQVRSKVLSILAKWIANGNFKKKASKHEIRLVEKFTTIIDSENASLIKRELEVSTTDCLTYF